MKVLLVSGGPKVSAQVTSALLGEDFSYFEVRTPQAALKVMENDPSFDLIVADCDTHPTGGFYLAREVRLRVADGHELPPVVLLVSRPQDEYLARWAEADAWVLKPVDPFDLAGVVSALVERTAVPVLPGVETLTDDRIIGPPPGKPPLSSGADFRVWARDPEHDKRTQEPEREKIEGGGDASRKHLPPGSSSQP